MELVNDFTVEVPVDEAWATLTDVERIAPCLPGAQLQEIEGDVYRGVVKVKVGPITAQFKGQATFVERDEVNHVARLKAEGRDTGGKGNASALITAVLEPVTVESTKVTVTTDLTITGKVAQFGRGALADVSTKLLHQFVEQLHETVLHPDARAAALAAAVTEAPTPGGVAEEMVAVAEAEGGVIVPDLTPAEGEVLSEIATGAPVVRRIDAPEAEPVDLMSAAGAPLLKRLLPVLGAVLVLILLLQGRKRRKARRAAS